MLPPFLSDTTRRDPYPNKIIYYTRRMQTRLTVSFWVSTRIRALLQLAKNPKKGMRDLNPFLTFLAEEYQITDYLKANWTIFEPRNLLQIHPSNIQKSMKWKFSFISIFTTSCNIQIYENLVENTDVF